MTLPFPARARPACPAAKARVDVSSRAILRFIFAALACTLPAHAQQLIGYVPTKDADVTGASEVMEGHAVLSGSVAVTAKDHTAPITLGRGGTVRVCQTSIVHLTESKAAPAASQVAAPLLISLDRGAIEVHMTSTASDAVMTPDLRFAIRGGGPLDLRLRVARNGDTCVDNRGTTAPILAVSDPFGESLYELLPSQHVLFEHGSLREVVDNERSPCGCPAAPLPPVQQVAALPTQNPGQPVTPPVAAAEHPFPAAASVGLAPTPSPARTPTPVGQQQTQVATTLSYDAAHPNAVPPSTVEPPKPAPTTGSTSGSPAGTSTAASATPPPAPPGAHDLFHSIGHFFHKMFHPHSNPSPAPSSVTPPSS